ncbi:Metallo-peptidase family M12-domain-containing protein [Gymnopilus junonius]|uniref:Disintegrin and metalloproteinase domain-containing protein B n=1 Tax=Gymnopilus junonius TaxID=109634 RepID=A0A9P5NIF4_GYMJU|nr:Metallo-peptidase family M12-domain-containing protein [Gymnopilus junonius]
MYLPSSLHAVVVLLLSSCLQVVHAHSSPAWPLKRVANPSTLSLEILPRNPRLSSPSALSKRLSPHPNTLRYNDSFRLILSAFNETFHLHLRPNDHLIHPAARIHYYTTTPDGHQVLSYTRPLLRESVKAYLGEVIAPHHSPARMREDAASVVPQPHPATLGWARIMVHKQGNADNGLAPVYEGAFSAKGVIYHIMTKENYLRNKLALDPSLSDDVEVMDSSLVIWRESDVMSPEEEHFAKTGIRKLSGTIVPPQSCGHDRLEYNDLAQHPLLKPSLPTSWTDRLLIPFMNDTMYRRDDVQTGNGGMSTNFVNSIGSTAGCPTTQKVIYMGVAADCTYVSNYGGQENATTQILNNWNSASALYKSTFNVSLGIAELQVRSEVCPSMADPTVPWNVPCSSAALDSRLSLFSQWRGSKGNDGLGLWHLMSGCPTGSEVGIAWLATLCQQAATGNTPSIVSGTAVSTGGRTEWQVVAHEIGHNFGAIHDCADGCTSTSGTNGTCCPLTSTTCDANAQFIMSPVAQSTEKVFSQCSIGNICSLMKTAQGSQVNTTCLVDPDPSRTTISLQMCGNGIVEAGEDCDPGIGATSSCCDVSTCKFKNNAVCDPESSPCCTAQCNFAPATQVCRPALDQQCDTAEYCTGNSSSCPANVMSKNGQSCGSNGLACASGQCTSVAPMSEVGASMGLKAACPEQNDQSCQISCQDPTNAGACIRLTSLLIEDLPVVRFGGTCLAGKCQSAGILDTAKAWYVQNLQIAIPVSVVAGLVAILLLWFLLRSVRRCCGSRRQPASRAVLPVTPPMVKTTSHERLASFDAYAPDRAGGSRTLPGSRWDFKVLGYKVVT